MQLFDTATVAITVSGIDLIALKKLTLVSYALAEKIGQRDGAAGREQATLAKVLEDLVRRIELKAAGAQ